MMYSAVMNPLPDVKDANRMVSAGIGFPAHKEPVLNHEDKPGMGMRREIRPQTPGMAFGR
jgi:hypothetical protein